MLSICYDTKIMRSSDFMPVTISVHSLAIRWAKLEISDKIRHSNYRALQSTYPVRTWHLRCKDGHKYGWSENCNICACRALYVWWSLPGNLCAWAENKWPAVGTVNGRGYDGQQIDAICDAHGPCKMIQSILKPFFLPIWTYYFHRCLDVQIRRF